MACFACRGGNAAGYPGCKDLSCSVGALRRFRWVTAIAKGAADTLSVAADKPALLDISHTIDFVLCWLAIDACHPTRGRAGVRRPMPLFLTAPYPPLSDRRQMVARATKSRGGHRNTRERLELGVSNWRMVTPRVAKTPRT